MLDAEPHMWSSDLPEVHPDNDALGRKEFAARAASAIRSWHRQEQSLVLGLNGEWGSGKSTLANFVETYLSQETKPDKKLDTIVVRFNPWRWSGQDLLCQAFFDEVSEKIRSSTKEKQHQQLAEAWKGLGRLLTVGKHTAKWIGRTADCVAGQALASGRPEYGVVAAGLSAAAQAVETSLEAGSELADAASTAHAEHNEETISDLRKKITDLLAAIDATILVIIDDVDRLTKEQVRMVMQLVKANADFPNVVYLLLYQKDIVARALEKDSPGHGPDFLRKIVQVELKVPDAPEDKLRGLFRKYVEPVLLRDRSHFDENRWDSLFDEHVWPYFRTPRDIKRFAGMFAFYYESHVIDGELDVNPMDLFLLEILRVFKPEAYEAVSRSFQGQKSIILGLLYGDDETRKRLVLNVESLLKQEESTSGAQSRSHLQAILHALIPQAQESFSASDSSDSTWNRDLRLCHSQHFSKYFQISRDPDDIPTAFISKLVKAGESRDQLRALLAQAINKYKWPLFTLIDRLFAVRVDIPKAQIEPLVAALFDLSDQLPGRDSMHDTPERALTRLVRAFLMQEPDRKRREEILRDAIRATAGISGPAMILSSLQLPKDRSIEEAQLPISIPVLDALQQEFAPRLKEAAQHGDLWKLRILSYLIWRHRDWFGEAATREWLRTAIRDPKTAAVLLRKTLPESQITGGSGTKSVYTLAGVELESFVDLDELAQAIAKLSPQPNDELSKAAIRALGTAIRRKQAKQPYEKIYVLSQDSKGNWHHEPEDLIDD